MAVLNDAQLTRRSILGTGPAAAARVVAGGLLAACGEADDDPHGNDGGNDQGGTDDPTRAPAPDPTATETPAAPNLLVTTLPDTGIKAVGQKVLETGRFKHGDKRLYSSYGHIVGAQLLTPSRRRFILFGTDTTWRNASSSSTG
jgi:hypothetical protein